MPPSGHLSNSVAGSIRSTFGSVSTSRSITSKGEPRPRPRFPRAALRLLEEWLSNHRQSPYPTATDFDHLTTATGLKRSQICNWFANVRKRGKVPSSKPIPEPTFDSLPPPTQDPEGEGYVPHFHRWLDSWTEHEAASLPAILEAVSQLNGTSSGSFLRGSTRLHRNFSQSSLSSMEVRSYAAVVSVHSDEWKTADDVCSTLTKSKRRHRRLPVQAMSSSCSGTTDPHAASKKFQCTFCPDRFRTKYDWQRHEKSIHLPSEKWTCSPHGSVDVDSGTNQVTCTFCGILDPSPEHIGGHGYTICATRPVAERTFYRKDHLRQHLRLMHGNCTMIPSMDSWKSVNLIRSRCGFCALWLETWDARVEHLAEHFCDGLSVAESWFGDWGFDDEVSEILERATLPGNFETKDMKGGFTTPSLLDSLGYEQSLDMERCGTLFRVDEIEINLILQLSTRHRNICRFPM